MGRNNFTGKNIILTGGCGFIGSHFNDHIMSNDPSNVYLIDNLSSTNSTEFIKPYLGLDNFQFRQIDIRNIDKEAYDFSNFDMIIHMAAQPSVPFSVREPFLDFEVNVLGSLKMLEVARKNNIPEFIFAGSGGTMYGNAKTYPTDENHRFNPISNYGAAKAAVEMYLSSYADLYGIKTTSLRFGNVFGPRSLHGVIHDFYLKLRKNHKVLKILGDGQQTKSYLYIKDCVNGFITASNRVSSSFQGYNMAAEISNSVVQIADTLCSYLGLSPKYEFTGSQKGWNGDVTFGELDSQKLKSMGWKQNFTIGDGIGKYLEWLKSYYNDPIPQILNE